MFNIKFTIENTLDAIKWFKAQVKKLKYNDNEIKKLKEQEEKYILDGTKKTSSPDKFEVGKMYLFHYDPKTKEKLPYYDTFPLIILLNINHGSFIGLNLHYLPYELRLYFLSALLTKAVLKDDVVERVRISYEILTASNDMQHFVKPCIKKYLTSHVKSSINMIESVDWAFAATLPVENFKKKDKEHVWKESTKTVNKERKH